MDRQVIAIAAYLSDAPEHERIAAVQAAYAPLAAFLGIDYTADSTEYRAICDEDEPATTVRGGVAEIFC